MSAMPFAIELRQRIEEALSPLLQGYRTCALVDFPNHPNVGDSAIWLGQETFLRASGLRVVYRCDFASYSMRRLAARLPQGLILLCGGGNFGDLWPQHQRFRETVVQDFPRHRIIQLPQSLCFTDSRNLQRARTILDQHPNLTLAWRDLQSLEISRKEFRAPSILCPDMALALGPLHRPTAPSARIVWLARTDLESKYDRFPILAHGVEQVDWLTDTPNRAVRLDHLYRCLLARYPNRLRFLWGAVAFNYQELARARLARGLRVLARGKVVITDRLHGHILSLLLGLPNVALDNSYGKMRAFHATWTTQSAITHWADSPEIALKKAVDLAEQD